MTEQMSAPDCFLILFQGSQPTLAATGNDGTNHQHGSLKQYHFIDSYNLQHIR